MLSLVSKELTLQRSNKERELGNLLSLTFWCDQLFCDLLKIESRKKQEECQATVFKRNGGGVGIFLINTESQ